MSSGGVDHRGVVVTGLGMVTPLGADRESTWSAVLAGRLSGQLLDPARSGPAWEGIAPSPDWRGCPIARDWSIASEWYRWPLLSE